MCKCAKQNIPSPTKYTDRGYKMDKVAEISLAQPGDLSNKRAMLNFHTIGLVNIIFNIQVHNYGMNLSLEDIPRRSNPTNTPHAIISYESCVCHKNNVF